jgi:hypothetical protein
VAEKLILGTRKGAFVFERSKDGFRLAARAHEGIPVPYAALDERTQSLWCSLDHGHWGQKLSRSRDLGKTFEAVEPPTYPEGAEIKPGVAATLRQIWTIGFGASETPKRLYLGTEPGGLFVSDDDGVSFTLVRGLWDHPSRPDKWFGAFRDHPAIHSISVDPRDPKRMLIGISVAGVFETLDGGESWTPRNYGSTATFLPDPNAEVGHDPHLLVRTASAPDVVWQQNHCGIFRSVDGAQTWKAVHQEGGPAFFGFAIAADADDERCAWIVPARSDERRMAIDGRLFAMRTDDGGKSWQTLSKGLPQDLACDVVYRHALDQRRELVAFGSTTGNVYWSEDRGESWRTLGNNFPPVYSLRLAD